MRPETESLMFASAMRVRSTTAAACEKRHHVGRRFVNAAGQLNAKKYFAGACRVLCHCRHAQSIDEKRWAGQASGRKQKYQT